MRVPLHLLFITIICVMFFNCENKEKAINYTSNEATFHCKVNNDFWKSATSLWYQSDGITNIIAVNDLDTISVFLLSHRPQKGVYYIGNNKSGKASIFSTLKKENIFYQGIGDGEGYLSIDHIDDDLISGSFEFSAISSNNFTAPIVTITNGFFKNIPIRHAPKKTYND